MNTNQTLARLGAVAAFLGAFLLFLGTLLHPTESAPNVPAAAFAEYAANSTWVWSHLCQFAGVLGLSLGFAAFAATIEAGKAAAWARFGLVGTVAVLAIAAALQAVDGVALKNMVDHWAAATGPARTIAFEAAFAVRQVEIGLASFFSILSGVTLAFFGMAIIFSARYPTWLGWVGLLDGLGMFVSGMAQALTGFSETAMNLSMPASIVMLIWVIVVGILMWRLAPRLPHVVPLE